MIPPPVPRVLLVSGLVALAADAVIAGRQRAARAVRKLGAILRYNSATVGDEVQHGLVQASLAIGRLAGAVAGCDCGDVDAEVCSAMKGRGDYPCACPRCHDRREQTGASS